MSSSDNLKSLYDNTQNKIQKIKNSNLSSEDKKILISSYVNKYNNKKRYLSNKNNSTDLSKNKTDNFAPSFQLLENFDDLNIVSNMVNNNFSEINSKLISNINSNKIDNKTKSYNNMFSYYHSKSSTLGPDGITTVRDDKTVNKNGKIKSKNSCYKVDKEGHKNIINCEPKKSDALLEEKKEHFTTPTNNFGKTVKVSYKK